MSTALSIAFTGLCALIGNGDGQPAEILLLDAKGVGEVGGITLPAHSPSLVVSLNDLANPDSSRPTRVIAGTPSQGQRIEQYGVWDLTGSEVRIRAQGLGTSGPTFFQPSKDETSWPDVPRDVHDPTSWRDLRYVADMKALVGDARVDPSILTDTDTTPSRLPRSVAARVYLEAGVLEGAIPSQASYREDMFEFKGSGSRGVVRQALTDTISWRLQTDASAVVIDIAPVGGGPAKRLLLAPSAVPHRLFVSNLPSENSADAHDHQAMSDANMDALHFGAYYSLLLNKPADRPLPEIWQPRNDRKGAGLIRPAFCPAILFPRP
jgi:hypothetical protein